MLSLEEQIERIADAAYAQTSAVEWRRPTDRDENGQYDGRRRRWLLAIAACVLTTGLVGGLIVLADNGRSDPLAPVDTGSPPASTQPIDTVPSPATTTHDATRDAVAPNASVSDPIPASMEWAFGHWIFRGHPDMWPALFGDTDSPQAATEQNRLRTQWFERFDEECSGIPHVDVAEPCGTAVPATPITGGNLADLNRRLDEAGWIEINEGWGFRGCDLFPFSRYLDSYQPNASFWSTDRAMFGAEEARVHGEIPLFRLSAAQLEIVGDQIVDLIDCDALSLTFPEAAEPVQIEELPASVPARGVIVGGDYAIFAVTTPRGGLAWMYLSGTVTIDMVTELANITSGYLDEIIE